jgi:2-polyprenyl-3-methyl-5-hydroxy-6-metoxy-1,4-benzoquinol methylase
MALGACENCGREVAKRHGLYCMLPSNEINDLIKKPYADNYEQLAQQNIEKSNINRRYLQAQAKNILRYIGSVKGKHICDLGVGQGFMAVALIEAGADKVTGIDISESYLLNLPKHSKILRILATAENIPFFEEFDVLTSTDVMEHVINLGSFLYCVNQAIKPKGILCLRVPYMKTVVHHSQFLGYPHQFGHLRSFDRKVLIMLLKTAGFSILKVFYNGFSLGMPNLFFRKGKLRKKLYNYVQRSISLKMADVNDVTSWNPWVARLLMMRNEIVVVARKTEKIFRTEEQGYCLSAIS